MGNGKLADRVCKECGKPFQVPERYLKRGRGTYCSRVCALKIVGAAGVASRLEQSKIRLASVNDWFWDRLDRSGGDNACWPWQQHLRGKYGRIKFGGKFFPASRFACTLAHGEPPAPEHLACHSCDNPPCCNPKHLWWGTHEDNMADAAIKGRLVGRAANLSLDRARKALVA